MSPNPRSHPPRSQPSPRARAVAEAPVGALLARVDELARRWAVALILERSLERVAELHLEMVAREAPALCAQIIRSLESDTELERLLGGDAAGCGEEPASARTLVALAGAGGAGSPAEVVEAVEALRGVLWEALLDELRWPASERSAARQVADLADRLAYVCATVLAAAVAAPDAVDAGEPVAQADGPAGHGPALGTSPIGPRGAILIDERDRAETPPPRQETFVRPQPPARPTEPARPREPARPQAPVRPQAASRRQERVPRPLPWDTPAHPPRSAPAASVTARPAPAEEPAPRSEPPAGPGEPPTAGPEGPQIEVRDERGEEGPAAWTGSIGRQLERFEQDQRPFAVLLVELGDPERLRRAALPAAMSSLTGRIERTLAQELQRLGGHPARRRGRPAGELTCERPGRYWMLVPETDATAAGRLAEWIVHTIGGLAGRSWAPLDVLVGIAVCPDDGRDAAELAAQADLSLYAQRPAVR